MISLSLLFVKIYILAQLRFIDKNVLLMISICFRSLSIYFVMFGVSVASFFDISMSYGKEERKTKYLVGKCHLTGINRVSIHSVNEKKSPRKMS